jgi:hypothetical protein
MGDFYGLPQPLTGSETVTIQQVQNGLPALCSMPLSELSTILGQPANWWSSLPTTLPTTSGIVWNNNGIVSIS